MDVGVRDFIRRETKKVVEFKNFDEVYGMFSEMIEYDIDAPCVEGLGQLLSSVLSVIAVEKIDRQDIVEKFPILWGKFEVFVKKMLHIVDKQNFTAYKKIRKRARVCSWSACGYLRLKCL